MASSATTTIVQPNNEPKTIKPNQPLPDFTAREIQALETQSTEKSGTKSNNAKSNSLDIILKDEDDEDTKNKKIDGNFNPWQRDWHTYFDSSSPIPT